MGSAWLRYALPEISKVSPAQVDAGVKVNFTITGKNFGAARDPLTGYLDATTGMIPCAPLVHISDSQAICLISPKKGQVQPLNPRLIRGSG